jgi:ADP-heptose:LPS heptosyltransferase
LPLRKIFGIIPFVNKIVCIDSFVQHAAAAFNKQSIVYFGGTSPKVLGYSCHQNISQEKCPTPFCHRPNTYLFDYLPNGQIWDCQPKSACMKFDLNEMIKQIQEK